MTVAVESVGVLCGALGGGERGIEDEERGDRELALQLRRKEEAASESFTINKHSDPSLTPYLTYLRVRLFASLMDLRSSSLISAGC